MRESKKLLITYINRASFVKADIEILASNYNVVEYQFKASKNIVLMLIEYLKQSFYLIFNMREFDLTYTWFADYHSLLPVVFSKLFRKHSFVVLGGYDVTFVKKINYGSFNNPFRAFCAKYSMRNSDRNLAVCDNIKKEALQKVPNAKFKVIYTGYDETFFKAEYNKTDLILTVGIVDTDKRFHIKNIDFFLDVVGKMPDKQFVAIGLNKEFIKREVPENLELIDTLPQKEIIKYYEEASVYVQFSLREGLPNSICEAMLCGCIPVGSKRGGIPIAIGNCGYVIDDFSLQEAAASIEKALDSTIIERKAARQHIIDNFTLKKRKDELLDLVSEKVTHNGNN